MGRSRRIATLAIGALLILALTGCDKSFCTDRSLLGFLFCDPALINHDPTAGPGARLVVHYPPIDTSKIRMGTTLGFSAEIEGAGNPFYPAGYASREEWDLDGDGSYERVLNQGVGTQRKVFHLYDRPGDFTVRLRVTDLEGNQTVDDKTIRILPKATFETLPQPTFTISPNPAMPGEEVHFDATGSIDPDGQIVDYAWEVRAGFGFSNAVKVSHRYSTNDIGTHDTWVRVTDNDGQRVEAHRPLVITDQRGPFNPVASFVAIPSQTNPREYLFDVSGSSDRDGRIVSYSWDFDGDGIYEHTTPSSIERTFPTDGLYHVKLLVVDDDGLTATFEDSVDVRTALLGIEFTASPNPARVGEQVRFEAAITTPGRTAVEHQWWLNPGGDFQLTGTQPFTTRFYGEQNIGTFEVQVRVSGDGGTTGIGTLQMTVNGPPAGRAARIAGARKRQARRFFAVLNTRAVRAPRARSARTLRGVRAAGSVRGRLLADRSAATTARTSAPAALAALLDARWTTRADLAGLLGGRRQAVTATVLATPRRAGLGRACIKLRIVRKGRRAPTGTYQVVGGAGAAARLHARGRIGFELRTRGRVAIAGTVRAKTGRSRPLPPGCAR